MTKEFKRHDGMKFEFSELRLMAYKKLLQLWNNTSTLPKLSTLISSMKYKTHKIDYADYQSLISDLCDVGLLSMHRTGTFGTNFWNSGISYEVEATDPEFLNYVFYNHTNSKVLHLAELKLLETKFVADEIVSVESNITPTRRFCTIV